MIILTRLNGNRFLLNADLIQFVESQGDTFITLTTGVREVVRESMEDILAKALDYQRQKHLIPSPLRTQSP